MNRWLQRFAGYRVEVTEATVLAWLNQFGADRDLAARILDATEFISRSHMDDAFRTLMRRLPGWHRRAEERRGNWRFVAFSGGAGESGDSMLHAFRVANNLTASPFDELFIHRRDLLSARLGPTDNVVFIDDFAGTGNQICRGWRETIEELLPEGPQAFICLPAATTMAGDRIARETALHVLAHRRFGAADNVFAPECVHFRPADKNILLDCCLRADGRNPRGYGDCGLLVVLGHRCPNNSIPILHSSSRHFRPLFPR